MAVDEKNNALEFGQPRPFCARSFIDANAGSFSPD